MDWLLRFLWRGIPKRGLSRWIGTMARWPISRKLIPSYAKFYQIDMSPVQREIHEFDHLMDFFTREYRTESRPIAPGNTTLVSPVDGVITQKGRIEKGKVIEAKGDSYSISELLGHDEQRVQQYEKGEFLTLYLSPKDYHRIHMPVDGSITTSDWLPGTLYPVNAMGVRLFPDLFARNERLISYMETNYGEIALIKVGATNVGSIKVNYDATIQTNVSGQKKRRQKMYDPPIELQKGEEVGRFEFGSTVILLAPTNCVQWNSTVAVGAEVKMGESLACFHKERP